VTALGSYLDARAHGGEWLLRIENLDPDREQPGSADAILATLEAYGLDWDGPVLYQNSRLETYKEALESLLTGNKAYFCACSRREVADSGIHGLEGPIYPGTCRDRPPLNGRTGSVRLRVIDETLSFEDAIQGHFQQHLASEIGDFIVRRTDGHFAYQLAVVLDDAFQGITDVVRGADLLPSTPRQIYLQRLLRLPHPTYMHLPVAVNSVGEKISKQTGAMPIAAMPKEKVLFHGLQFLRQQPPSALCRVAPGESLKWAIDHWNPAHMQNRKTQEIALETL
jgi:glutamyl-Q tRNA(Asp) synthetase